MTELANLSADTQHPSSAHLVHAVVRFLRVARYRRNVIIAALVAVCLLGVVYYATATRVYQARASLLVLQTGPDVWSTSMTSEDNNHGLMPTYERLFTSDVVLKGALKQLNRSAPEIRVDFVSHPKGEWLDILRENLSTYTIRRTNIIEIRYKSKDPRAAVAVVKAIIHSYLDFMDRNHKNVAADIVRILDKERGDVEQRLVRKERQLLEAKHRFGDLGMKEDSPFVHPVVQRAVRFNEEMIEVRQQRIHLEASLAAVRAAVQNGSDLKQHLLAVEPFAGRELVLSALGLSSRDAEIMADPERKLLDDRAKLSMLREHLGPMHPRVVEVTQLIRNAEEYLANLRRTVDDRLANVQGGQLGGMLLALVQEELAKTRSHENRLDQQYRQAESRAIELNGRMAELAILEHDLQLDRNLHDVLLNRIATIDINQNQADVRVRVVGEPLIADEPVSPKLSAVALICLLGGFGVGSLIVYVMDVLDDRFRSPEELKDQLGVPLLAMVHKFESRVGVGIETLQVHAAPEAVDSEAFRTLRTTLAFSGEQVKQLVFTSAEPGDGKTTVVANLGVSYAQAGKKTLILDADVRRPGLTNLFAMSGEGGLSEVLKSDGDVADACVQRVCATGIDGLDILPCGTRSTERSELLSSPVLAEILAWAETVYDQILVDTPPILAGSDAAVVGRLVDGIVLVLQPDKNHRRRVLRAVEDLMSLNIKLFGTVVNRITSAGDHGYYGYDSGYGYGYGYGDKTEDEDQDGDEPVVGVSMSDSPSTPDTPQEGHSDSNEGDDQSNIVPRRVA